MPTQQLPGISCHAMAKVKKKDGKEIMTCKAWNGRCVLSWLSNELLQALGIHHDNDLLALVCSCATHGFYIVDWVDQGFPKMNAAPKYAILNLVSHVYNISNCNINRPAIEWPL